MWSIENKLLALNFEIKLKKIKKQLKGDSEAHRFTVARAAVVSENLPLQFVVLVNALKITILLIVEGLRLMVNYLSNFSKCEGIKFHCKEIKPF